MLGIKRLSPSFRFSSNRGGAGAGSGSGAEPDVAEGGSELLSSGSKAFGYEDPEAATSRATIAVLYEITLSMHRLLRKFSDELMEREWKSVIYVLEGLVRFVGDNAESSGKDRFENEGKFWLGRSATGQ